MIILRKPGSRVLSPRVLELSIPTDSGPGRKTLRLEGTTPETGPVIEDRRLATLEEYTREFDRALAMGFVPTRRAPTPLCPRETAEQRTLTIGSGMGTAFAASDDDEETPCRK